MTPVDLGSGAFVVEIGYLSLVVGVTSWVGWVDRSCAYVAQDWLEW